MNEHGPFSSERQAMSTPAGARIRAAYDARPGTGASIPARVLVMTDACAECGVDIGALDLITLKGIAWRETYETVCVAGMIRRAFKAGKAAGPDGTVTEWGVRYTRPPGALSGTPAEVRVDRGADRSPVTDQADGASHAYTSTACFHGDCGGCRNTCKYCDAPCSHACHPAAGSPLPEPWVDQARGIARELLRYGLSTTQAVPPELLHRITSEPALFWLRGEEVPPGEWRTEAEGTS